MKRNRIRRFFQQRQYAIVSFIFFVAIAGMTGVYLSNRITRDRNENEIAQKEAELFDHEKNDIEDFADFSQDTAQKEPDSILNSDKNAESSEQDVTSVNSVIKPQGTNTETNSGSEAQPDEGQNAQTAEQNQQKTENTAVPDNNQNDTSGNQSQSARDQKTAARAKAASSSKLHFSPETDLSWPMQGDVILNYSMDQTVYFATLEQYKYNPAIIIAGKVNDSVNAAAAGKITDISTNEETGVTVTMDLGDGYSAVYGQLKEVLYKEGAVVEAGNAIGYIAEPTKYYSVEGSNLYFKLLKDGEPINPMQYME